jgi:hypothetical protein
MESMFFIIAVLFILAGTLTGSLAYILSLLVYAESKATRIVGKTLGLIFSALLLRALMAFIWGDIKYMTTRLSEMEFGYSYIVTLLVGIIIYTILTICWLTPPILGFYLGGSRKKRKIAEDKNKNKTIKP